MRSAFDKTSAKLRCAPVAQLDRVPGYEPGGRGFESYPAHQKFIKNREAAMPHGFLLSAPGVAPASIGAIADCRFLLCLFPSYNERTFWPQSLGCGICLDKYRTAPASIIFLRTGDRGAPNFVSFKQLSFGQNFLFLTTRTSEAHMTRVHFSPLQVP